MLRHALVCLSVLLITMNVLWDEPTEILADRYGAWGVYFLLFIVVIYVNMYLLVPQFLLQGKTQKYLLLLSLLMVFFLFSVGMLQDVVDDSSIPVRTPAWIGIISGFATFSLLIIGLTALQFFKYSISNQHKIRELEDATMRVELANLQNQVNPHFLFNMLNNANIMVEQDAQKSSEILSSLQALLKYQLDSGSDNSVNLKDDIAFLERYLELEKLRRDRFQYTIQAEGDSDVRIPPLLFIPFVENAVKHNPGNDGYVDIRFNIRGNCLYFECKNNKPTQPVVSEEGGIGLVNIRRRLDLLYGGGYRLELNDGVAEYIVNMEVEL